jgi:hypothetical protein
MPLHMERHELRADRIKGGRTFLLKQTTLLHLEVPRIASRLDVRNDLTGIVTGT